MFTGRRLDPETRTGSRTGLYYYRARMYDPELGRFMQTDPIGYYDAMNLYQYAFNSPTNYLDPWGLSSKGSGNEKPWYKKLALTVVLPSISGLTPFIVGGGAAHELVWIPGQGWRSYVYPQVGPGLGLPGPEAHVGLGPIFNIESHDDYRWDYASVGGMTPPTPYGSFGADVSFWKGSPTAVHINWGLSTGGISGYYQYYVYTKDFTNWVKSGFSDTEGLKRVENE